MSATLIFTPLVLVVPLVIVGRALFWHERLAASAREEVVKFVKGATRNEWVPERAQVRTLLKFYARTKGTFLVPNVDQVYEHVAAFFIKEIDDMVFLESIPKKTLGTLRRRLVTLRAQMTTDPPVVLPLWLSFMFGSSAVLVLLLPLVYVPALIGEPSPLQAAGEMGNLVAKVDSFWDEVFGLIGSIVSGGVATWRTSIRHGYTNQATEADSDVNASTNQE